MRVSELNKAAELFLLENGDADVRLLYEEAVFEDGFEPEIMEVVTDIRKVDDWPLPGRSLLFPNEGSEMGCFFVLMYANQGV